MYEIQRIKQGIQRIHLEFPTFFFEFEIFVRKPVGDTNAI